MVDSSMAYGDRVLAVEPGGAERIPPENRHGKPRQLLWTWTSPNLEFTTIFIGILAVSVWKLNFYQALTACALGNLLAALAHGALSARGPQLGASQMVVSRLAFGRKGNIVPTFIMAVSSGVGWFAANSASGAFALASLTGAPVLLTLFLIVLCQTVLAFAGHNLVQAFERWAFPVLLAIFTLTSLLVVLDAAPLLTLRSPLPLNGNQMTGFLLTVGASFGYAAGWTPYASDYTRYLPQTASPLHVGLASGVGLFLSCTVLEAVGAASVYVLHGESSNPAHSFAALLPVTLAGAALAAFALGSTAANALNLYSATLAITSITRGLSRSVVAVAMGILGGLASWAALADPAASYESFLLLMSYWVGPWVGVVLMDRWLHRSRDDSSLIDDPHYQNPLGLSTFLCALILSVVLFANQRVFIGIVPRHLPQIGDIAALVGAALSAIILWVRTRTSDRALITIQETPHATGITP